MLDAFEVVEAANGQEAQEILADDQRFDLVLCDVMMPGISGMALHQWLEQEHPSLAGRLIFITGGAFTPKVREYLATVQNPSLEKPFRLRQVLEMVSSMIQQTDDL